MLPHIFLLNRLIKVENWKNFGPTVQRNIWKVIHPMKNKMDN